MSQRTATPRLRFLGLEFSLNWNERVCERDESGVVSEDSRLEPLSGCMTKWEYMVVQLRSGEGGSVHTVFVNGEKASEAKTRGWNSNRYKMLNKVGSQGWELIKIRGDDTSHTFGLEHFTFKRPL